MGERVFSPCLIFAGRVRNLHRTGNSKVLHSWTRLKILFSIHYRIFLNHLSEYLKKVFKAVINSVWNNARVCRCQSLQP
jgi:hypothetical protein